MDNVQSASVAVAIGKARTAATFRRPTKAIEDVIAGGRAALVTFPDAVAVQGGVPLAIGGSFLGGIGVSGVQSDQDEVVARAGAEALK
jgi:glc operon protein GlcG